MKIRQGFVSNSSSSSFVVRLCHLTPEQINKIMHHDYWGAKLKIEYAETDTWSVYIEGGVLFGDTSMDNFDMEDFMRHIGVNMTNVKWDDGYGRYSDDLPPKPVDTCDDCHMRFICFTNR